MGEYQKSIEILRDNQGIWDMGSNVTNCLNWNCYEGPLHGDAASLLKEGKEGMAYLCDPANDFLGMAKRLIVLYEPKPLQAFETKIQIIRLALNTIKMTGKTPKLEQDLTENISLLKTDIQGIRGSLNEMKNSSWSERVLSASRTLSGYTAQLLGHRTQCLLSRCGILGHGNPANGVMYGARRLEDGCTAIVPALQSIAAFCNQVIAGLANAESRLQQLKDSHPADHVEEALKLTGQLSDEWHGLMDTIENE